MEAFRGVAVGGTSSGEVTHEGPSAIWESESRQRVGGVAVAVVYPAERHGNRYGRRGCTQLG